jgi:hypothetical protein
MLKAETFAKQPTLDGRRWKPPETQGTAVIGMNDTGITQIDRRGFGGQGQTIQ